MTQPAPARRGLGRFELQPLLSPPAGIEIHELHGSTPENTPYMAYLARIPLSRFRLTYVHDPARKTVTQFTTAQQAACGFNGGFYTLDQGRPLDWLVIDGQTITPLSNRYRPAIVVTPTGIHIDPSPDAALPTMDALQAGPLLVHQGEPVMDYDDFIRNAAQFDSDITANRHPRSALGLSADHVLLLAVDGRCEASAGLYLEECAELLVRLGALSAINLDGGGSSMLVVGDRLLNHPRTWHNQPEPAERPIPTALLFHAR